MKSIVGTLIGVAAACAFAPAMANPDLAARKNCLSCHSIDERLLGPSFKEVSVRYAGQKDAVDKLALKVLKGSKGAWGPNPMPANKQVTEAEAKQLVAWVLTLK